MGEVAGAALFSCRRRGITARTGVDSSERVGGYRWAAEPTISWVLAFRRLAVRYHRSATTIPAVATRTITIICARR